MLKILLVLRDETFYGEREVNDNFREAVKYFMNMMVDVNNVQFIETTSTGQKDLKDFSLVFIAGENLNAATNAAEAGILTFEYNFEKLSPVKIIKDTSDGFTTWTKNYLLKK